MRRLLHAKLLSPARITVAFPYVSSYVAALGVAESDDLPLADETISAGHGKETDIGIADKYAASNSPLTVRS